ncbi:MAG TPA: amylo-alpha-1,6-glucosidase [Polyangiaceae bacterium]|nr:amylo-alpha-1,6-glucosidase [Polyangiaceae bacterium]
MAALVDSETEWLEADGLGGFASGTTCGIATRRYHALLLVSARPPSERFVLVNGFTAWLETAGGALQLTRHHYAPGVTTEAQASVESFESEPWPTVRYRTRSGLTLSQEILVERGRPLVVLRFHLETPTKGVTLCVRPLLSGRDFHSTHHENAAFRFEPGTDRGLCVWAPYPGVPAIRSWSNGEYRHAPDWYRRFRYAEEQRRGLDCDEDLAAPGVLRFDLGRSDALWLLSASTPGAPELSADGAEAYCRDLLERERARRVAYPSALERAADAYVVARGDGRSVIAGYPWFSDWGRDTFIALRGLCLATGRLEAARGILVNWSGLVSEGMLPNRFLEHGSEPEYNSVDASLWYVIAASELLRHPRATGVVSLADARALRAAISEIISGYVRGTRFGIRCDADGLLSAGEPGSQLTWMDAKVGDHVVTPRSGKPVEIQALWVNALHCAAELSPEFPRLLARARQSFEVRFWNAELGALYDVIDVNHRQGDVDPTIRPNQIFAAGGLPITLLSEERARRVVDLVERQLWTPLGLRSLSPQHAHYAPQYRGGVRERDVAYHQGTVWPWLMGPFVEAWVRSRGGAPESKSEARRRFLLPLREHLSHAGIGHVSEIADAELPHAPRGCPFQAWSLAELLRLELLLRE